MARAFINGKQIMVDGQGLVAANNDTTINVSDGTSQIPLNVMLKELLERMKKLEDDFHDHILLRQPLEQSEKKSEFVNR